MTADVNEKLGKFLSEGQNWKKKPTNIQGVFLLKLPSPPSIAIEVNPVIGSASGTKKRRGIIIRSSSELEQFNQLLSNPKVTQLTKKIEEVNPKTKEVTMSSNIFEI
jgi:hypothetical protein